MDQPVAVRPDEAQVRALERNRNGARAIVAVGVGGLFVSGAFPHLFGRAAEFVFLGLLVVLGWGIVAWMYWGWRLRRTNDPWAYDPDVDGPDPRVRRGLEHAEREAQRKD